MSEKADAHIHLFEGGYQGDSLAKLPGVSLDEPTLYNALRQTHDIDCALVVGYAGEPWCTDNNEYIASMAKQHAWVKPVAYCDPTAGVTVQALEQLQGDGFVGLSIYTFTDEAGQALRAIDEACWNWLAEKRWLISANSKGGHWDTWKTILEAHPDLPLLVSHLGLPGSHATPPTAEQAASNLQPVLQLSKFANTHVKLSGFYAISDPGHDYPHAAALPYVELLLNAFGCKRLLWGSDFSPCLGWLSFPQACDVLKRMACLSDADRSLIYGENLRRLLGEVGGDA